MHPFVKILFFILILLLMNFLSIQFVWLLCLSVCAFAAWLNFRNFLRLVKRMRWLFISIFFIYAFDTPGEYIREFPASFQPTFEGCSLGLLQIAKLLIAVASLSMLFSTSSKEHLISGLYMLFSPLKWLGFNVARFSARLLLTLDYVEDLAVEKKIKFSFKLLDDIHVSSENLQDNKAIVLQQPHFKIADKLIIIAIFGFLIILLIKELS